MKSVEKGFNILVFLFGMIYLFIKGDKNNGIILLVTYIVSLGIFGLNGIGLVAIIMLIGNTVVAWKWHNDYVKSLQKRDFEIVNPDQSTIHN